MSDYTPPFPKLSKKRIGTMQYLFRGWYSWIHVLYEKSFSMKMGQVRLPHTTIYIVNEPSLVKRTMVDEWESFPKHKLLWSQLRSLLGNSIFTTNGEVWKKQRRMIDPAFQGARLKVVLPLMQASIDSMLQRLDNSIKQPGPLDVEVEMTHITADIIFRTILSTPITTEDAHLIFDNFNKFQQKALRGLLLKFFRMPAFFYERQADKFAGEIRNIIATMVRPRYDDYHSGKACAQQDILASLLEEKDPDSGEHFEYEEIVDHVCMLFLAGHETSASTLTWALYLIANKPDVQERMYQESTEVLQGKAAEFGGLKKMRVCWNVFRETLRLYPPVGYFMRETTKTETLRDKKVKPGCPVMIAPLLIQRHRELWKRPDVFDPDRFDSEESAESQKNAYLPFGAGPRVCIGAAFATQEAILILANLAQRYHFEPIAGDVPEPVGRVTIRSANGVRLKVTAR